MKKIIKEGIVKEKLYRFICEKCDGLFDAGGEDIKRENDSRNDVLIRSRCPTIGCENDVYYQPGSVTSF